MARWKWILSAMGLPFAVIGGGLLLSCVTELQKARPFLLPLIMAWPMGVIFSLMGLGLVLIAIFGKQVEPGSESPLALRKRLMGIRSPVEQWRDGRLVAQGQTPVFFGWLRFAAGILFSAPFAWVGVTRGWIGADAAYGPWCASLLIPAALAAQVAYRLRRFQKYGSSTADILERPGAATNRFRVMIRPEKTILTGGQARVTLRCEKREMRGSGKHRRLAVDVLWSDRQQVEIQPAGLGIDAAFVIPPELPDASPQRNEGIFWLLDVGSSTEGVDYAAQFDVALEKGKRS